MVQRFFVFYPFFKVLSSKNCSSIYHKPCDQLVVYVANFVLKVVVDESEMNIFGSPKIICNSRENLMQLPPTIPRCTLKRV